MAERKPLQEVEVRFEQAAQFRTIHVDGAWGGVTPGGGGIAVNVYHEHSSLPSSLTITLTDGKISRKPTDWTGIVRVVETELRMTPDVARALAAWLVGKADDADRFTVLAGQEAAGSSDSSGPAS